MVGLYIHIPFCDKKCFYCSFVVVVGQSKRADVYIDCIKQEALKHRGKNIDSIYIGGGTPSLCSKDQLAAMFEMIHQVFVVSAEAEITIEANPEGLDKDKLKFLKALGVNRMSIGIQTFNNGYLTYLGRIHDKDKALQAYDMTRQAGFTNISCDLMYSFPEEDDQQILADVDTLLRLRCEHVSLYALTLEPNSRFYTKDIPLPSNQRQAHHYKLIVDSIARGGYAQYEVSNFAKPGYESKHNINYWESGDYIGLGVGAHSHMNGERWENVSQFGQYMRLVQAGESPQVPGHILNKQERLVESILFGLRMLKGVNIVQLEERFDCLLDPGRRAMIDAFVEEGLLHHQDSWIKATKRGLMVLDEISSRFI